MTRVHLVRHGQTDLAGQRLCGVDDPVGLNAEGRARAEGLAERLAGGAVRLVTSPARRARETAAPLAARLGVEPEIEAALGEIDFGRWTGCAFADLEGDPDWRRWNARRDLARTPGGESMAEVQARVAVWLSGLNPGSPVVAVSHADVIRAAVLWVLRTSLREHHRFAVDPASITTLAVVPGGGFTLERLNLTHDPAFA